ncbi:hypothetical protein BKA60DRAFT_547215 [Fusarium oxysporum]|nr:hypothetical protein BKA60DRAFT_547215 [Fusarium oxysporum]
MTASGNQRWGPGKLERAHGPNILVLTQTPKDPKGEGARAAKAGIGLITSGNWYSRGDIITVETPWQFRWWAGNVGHQRPPDNVQWLASRMREEATSPPMRPRHAITNNCDNYPTVFHGVVFVIVAVCWRPTKRSVRSWKISKWLRAISRVKSDNE